MSNANEIFELEWGTPGGDPPPAGFYRAKFVGLELIPAKKGEDGKDYDEAIGFKFEVLNTAHKGKICGNIGSKRPTPNNITGRLLTSMGFAPGGKTNVRDCIGKEYDVAVGPNKAGRMVVTMAMPPKP